MKTYSLPKKTLVVSSWAPPMIGGPQSLYNLFSQFSPESYCILTSSNVVQGKIQGTPLPCRYFFYDRGYAVDSHDLGVSIGRTSHFRDIGWPIFRGAVPRIVGLIISVLSLVYTIVRMTKAGIHLVYQEGVRCLVGISDQTGAALISTYIISVLTRTPYVLYLFDLYKENELRFLHKFVARLVEKRLFTRASVIVVTNEGTLRFYRSRYKSTIRFEVVHNSVFPSAYESERTAHNPTKPYKIVYTGMVYWPQERSLMNLFRTMDELREFSVRLDLYVPNATLSLERSLEKRSNIRLMSASQSEMPSVQCKATVLFLPLSWQTRAPDIVATATPGKLIDYLASGRPILIHAPPYSYISQYARENSFALVVDVEDTQVLREALLRLLQDVRYSKKLVRNALRTLRKNHDATRNALRLAEILSSV
jgi:glycosyltransferase involved in cell wall biosynthesis